MKRSAYQLGGFIGAMGVCVLYLGCSGGGHASEAKEPAERKRAIREEVKHDVDDGLDIDGGRGTIDTSYVASAVEERHSEVMKCVTKELRNRPYVGGKVTLTWRIAKAGPPAHVWASDSDMGSESLHDCLRDIGMQMEFPAPDGKFADVSIPFGFDPAIRTTTWDAKASRASFQTGATAIVSMCGHPRGDYGRGEVDQKVRITVFLGEGGAVESFGIASDAPLPDAWLDCAKGMIPEWTAEPGVGQIVKAQIEIGRK